MAAIGPINPPWALSRFDTVENGGVGQLLNMILKVMVIGAGIYALFNFILAGYAFLSAGDDPKQIQSAWAKIYQSVIGLLFAAGALVLAAIFGLLIFGDATFLLQPTLPSIAP